MRICPHGPLTATQTEFSLAFLPCILFELWINTGIKGAPVLLGAGGQNIERQYREDNMGVESHALGCILKKKKKKNLSK